MVVGSSPYTSENCTSERTNQNRAVQQWLFLVGRGSYSQDCQRGSKKITLNKHVKTDCFKILFKNVTFANRRTLPQIHSSTGVRASKMLMSVVKNVYIEFYFCKIISSKYRTAVLVKTWLSSD